MAKDMSGDAPSVVRTYATTNSKGKSMSNAGATAANKRGVTHTMAMNDSKGMAKAPSAGVEIL